MSTYDYDAMKYDYTKTYNATKMYDCEPTLTDTQAIEFCKQGFLMLEGVVPDEINRRAFEFLDRNTYYEPTEILEERWFVENVIFNPQAAGAVRSLLGRNFGPPILMSNHRVQCPQPAQNWHRDGGSQHGIELNYLQVFYYPQATPLELGPIEVLPGSHFRYARHLGHYGSIRGAIRTAAPAGSIFLTVYSIWHRRSASTASGMRNMLKYNYWRMVPPERDWVIEPDFDFATANYGASTDMYDVARMFFWLCGKADEFLSIGGQGWPYASSNANQMDKSYGYPSGQPR